MRIQSTKYPVMLDTQCCVTCVFLRNVGASYLVKREHPTGHIVFLHITDQQPFPTNVK